MSAAAISPAERIAHDTALQADPAAHPSDCATCAALAKESTTVNDAEKLAAAEKRAADAEAKLADETKRANDAEEAAKVAQKAATDADHEKVVEAKDREIDGLNAKVTTAEKRASDAEASVAALDAVRAYIKERAPEATDEELADPAAFLAALDKKAEDAEKLAAVKAERVKALDGLLPEDRIEARADYYAGLADDAWTEQLADLKAQAGEGTGPTPRTPVIPGIATAAATGSGLGSEVAPAIDAADDPLGMKALQSVLAGRSRD